MAKVVDFDELYPGRFIKAGDLKGRDWTLTIASVDLEELQDQKGKRGKGVISFSDAKKELVLNRTNGECLKAMFGRKLPEWVGKRVTLYPAKIESDLSDLAIRVRGSPDIASDVSFDLCLPRKKPRKVLLKKTGKPAAKPAPEPEPEPEVAAAADALAPTDDTAEHDTADVDS